MRKKGASPQTSSLLTVTLLPSSFPLVFFSHFLLCLSFTTCSSHLCTLFSFFAFHVLWESFLYFLMSYAAVLFPLNYIINACTDLIIIKNFFSPRLVYIPVYCSLAPLLFFIAFPFYKLPSPTVYAICTLCCIHIM